MEQLNIDLMKEVERDYKKISGLEYRSEYKIFYCGIRRAPILIFGMNPGGDPATHSKCGLWYDSPRGRKRAAASGSFYENNEHDLIDCRHWPYNRIRNLFLHSIFREEEQMRHNIIQMNLAFRRSRDIGRINYELEKNLSRPLIKTLMEYIKADAIIVCGKNSIDKMRNDILPGGSEIIIDPLREKPKGAPILGHARGEEITGRTIDLFEVAHPSRYSGYYHKYNVGDRILSAVRGRLPGWLA